MTDTTKIIPGKLVTPGWDHLTPEQARVVATFSYNDDAPLAIHAKFQVSGDEVHWQFGRDLMAQGIVEPAGVGDVRFWPSRDPHNDILVIVLQSPEGLAHVEFPAVDVESFLEQTYTVCAVGSEDCAIDWDAVAQDLLS